MRPGCEVLTELHIILDKDNLRFALIVGEKWCFGAKRIPLACSIIVMDILIDAYRCDLIAQDIQWVSSI